MKPPSVLTHYASLFDQLISAKLSDIAECQRDGMLDGHGRTEGYRLFRTMQIDLGRQSGHTHYIATHATGEDLAITGGRATAHMLTQYNPHARLYTLEDIERGKVSSARIVYIDTPMLATYIGNRCLWRLLAVLDLELIVIMGSGFSTADHLSHIATRTEQREASHRARLKSET